MQKFETKKFDIGKLKGISEKNVEEHLKLYQGYVNNANTVLEKIENLSKENAEGKFAYEISELQRRFAFEFGGVRNHEYFFTAFENGPKEISKESDLYKKISEDFGSFEKWFSYFKTMATTRGIGWAMLYFDKTTGRLLNQWVDEHHLGQLSTCEIILALDMWEHAFVFDYQPSGKKNYVEDFFENLNWKLIEQNFENIKR